MKILCLSFYKVSYKTKNNKILKLFFHVLNNQRCYLILIGSFFNNLYSQTNNFNLMKIYVFIYFCHTKLKYTINL